jgi:DNA repair exonuclease SbcCD ATPase subunit
MCFSMPFDSFTRLRKDFHRDIARVSEDVADAQREIASINQRSLTPIFQAITDVAYGKSVKREELTKELEEDIRGVLEKAIGLTEEAHHSHLQMSAISSHSLEAAEELVSLEERLTRILADMMRVRGKSGTVGTLALFMAEEPNLILEEIGLERVQEWIDEQKTNT